VHLVTQCLGTVDFVIEKGLPMLQWQFKGLYNEPVHDASSLPTANRTPWLKYNPTGKANTLPLSLFGANLKCYSFSAALGEEAIYDDSLDDEEIIFGDRNATAKCQIEAPTTDVLNLFAKSSDAERGVLLFTHGKTPGDIFKLSAPSVQLPKKPTYQKLDNKKYGHDLELSLLPENGQDDIEIVYE
jgi:hypothetical protein